MVVLDGVLEAVALDEGRHGIERPAVGVPAEAVHRHDAGVLQAAGDLRFQQKARPATEFDFCLFPEQLW